MSEPLATKLCAPPLRSNLVSRPRLIERINSIQEQRLFLISAPAGFGKSTLIVEWISMTGYPVAWLSLDEGDCDLTHFLSYFVYALQNIIPDIGEEVLGMLASPQPPDPKLILTNLINEIARFPENIFLVLDDYHVIEESQVDNALSFLLENMPSQLHLIITTREDPQFPLSRLRTRNQMTELRSNDLRFTTEEAANFLNNVMDLKLSTADISALESRTEGWVAGLQLAGISMQGLFDKTSFIQSFTGSHQYVMDFLVEEVLEKQSESVQRFLLQTSILKRLCGPLCDAVLDNHKDSGQKTLEYLDQNNLFLIPLDNERRWYRYHHLFADLLKQRFSQGKAASEQLQELHTRASIWHENNGSEIEAFEHAVAANDLERAERIVEGDGIPLHFRGEGHYVLRWLETLPKTELISRPSLQVMYASTLLFVGQHTAVEKELQAAETALGYEGSDEISADLIGRIAAIRATLAVISNDIETIMTQALHAQEYLHPKNQLFRSIATWSLGVAHQLKEDREAASEAFAKTIAIGGDTIYTIAATINLGQIQEKDSKLTFATKNYKNAIKMGGEPPQLITCEAYLGLARIYYEFNDFDSAQKFGQQALHLIQQMEKIDSFASYGIFLARLMLARGDVPGAVNILNETELYVHNHNFEFRMPDVAEAQVLAYLRLGDMKTAANLAQRHKLPLSQARVHLAQGNPAAALALLKPLYQQIDTTSWRNEQLKTLLLMAVTHHKLGDKNKAIHHLGDVMALTEQEGYIRSFVDEGIVMKNLLSEAIAQRIMPGYASKLMEIIQAEKSPELRPTQSLIIPLSKREMEILALIAAGLKNKEIAEKLFVSINTILYHTKNIYNKLGVNKRTLAILKARELNLLQDE